MQNTPSVLRLSNTPTFTPSFLLSELSLNRRMSQDIFARFCKYVGPWNLKSVWCTLELSFHRNMSHDKSRKPFSRWIMHATSRYTRPNRTSGQIFSCPGLILNRASSSSSISSTPRPLKAAWKSFSACSLLTELKGGRPSWLATTREFEGFPAVPTLSRTPLSFEHGLCCCPCVNFDIFQPSKDRAVYIIVYRFNYGILM